MASLGAIAHATGLYASPASWRITLTSQPSHEDLLPVVLDAWDRHDTIMRNLVTLVPDGAFTARAAPGSPSVGQMLMHMVHERLISVSEEAPEHGIAVPREEWAVATDPETITAQLARSAAVVRAAIEARIRAGRALDRSYDHPLLMLQLLLWHEAYHHGQIKLTLKLAGAPVRDEDAGPLTWSLWRRRTR